MQFGSGSMKTHILGANWPPILMCLLPHHPVLPFSFLYIVLWVVKLGRVLNNYLSALLSVMFISAPSLVYLPDTGVAPNVL